jgi:phosphatidylinositol alpha-mannosyltransferase
MQNRVAKLKVGLVLDDSLDKSDGVQQYVLGIGQWLSQQGHEVHYLVGATKRQDLNNVHSLSNNIAVRFNGNRMSMPLPSSRKKLQLLLSEEKFDVLHIQLPYSPYLAHRIIMSAGSNTAVIGTFHIAAESVIVKSATRMLGGWTKKSIHRFDTIVSVSKAAKVFAKKTFRVNSAILPNVIDYDHFANGKPLPQYTNDAITILFLGRLVPRKGCLTLLKAVAKIKQMEHMPAFQIVICGKGPLESKLKEYAVQHNLSAVIDFVGYVSEDEKPRYYASADIAVFPSTGGESFGIVLLEAMAGGHAAVLAGANAGYSSVLESRPDLLFDPHDFLALADKLKEYMQNSHLRIEAQKWGQQFSASYDTSVIGPKLVNIYREALRNHNNK